MFVNLVNLEIYSYLNQDITKYYNFKNCSEHNGYQQKT